MRYTLIFSQVIKYIPLMLDGLKLSIIMSCIGMASGSFLGLICAILITKKTNSLKRIIYIYIEVFRNTPLLIQMYLLYFGLAQFNMQISALISAITALALNTGAYTCVIFQTGLQNIDSGQLEAASALGMNQFQRYTKIIIPQAFRIVFAPLTNQFISLFLFSSVAATIAVPELLSNALLIDSKSMRTFEVFIIVTIIYLAITTLISLASSIIEKRFRH